MGEGDGDVDEDDGGVGEDRGDDDGPRRCSGATGSKGREPPSSSSSLTFSLDGRRVPLWSLAPIAWEGREPLRDWIYLSVSALVALADSTPSPFLKYPEIRNSDWGESFAQIFLIKLAFLHQKKSVNRLTGGP